MPAGILTEYKHYGRSVSVPYKGPLEDGKYEQVMGYYKWLWELLRKGGLASYSYRLADIRWHMSTSCAGKKGVFETAAEARQFFYKYSRPRLFLAVNPELAGAMRKDIAKNDGPPHQLELVTEENGLVNMRLYEYAQLDGTSPKGTRVHVWWPGHVYFNYRAFLQDNKNWLMDCSAKREATLNRKKKPARRGSF